MQVCLLSLEFSNSGDQEAFKPATVKRISLCGRFIPHLQGERDNQSVLLSIIFSTAVSQVSLIQNN